MSINKVQLKNGNVLLDVTDVGTNASNVLSGVKYIDNAGNKGTGEYVARTTVADLIKKGGRCSYYRGTSIDIGYVDLSNIVQLDQMFFCCYNLQNLDLTGWDVSSITTMQDIFNSCTSLTNLDVSNWNTSNVNDMANAFSQCHSLTSLNVSNWNTSNVTNMYGIFNDCYNLSSIDLSNWNTSNVTSMYNMFSACYGLTSLDLSSFNTTNVKSMGNMFGQCQNLSSLNISSFNTSNVTYMSQMFSSCQSLTSLDLSSFDTSNVTNMYHMFDGCSSLTSLDLSNFDTSNVTSAEGMFSNCNSLQTLKLPMRFNENQNSLYLENLTNLQTIYVPTPALSYYTDNTAAEYNSYFANNPDLVSKIVGYAVPTTTYTFVTDGGSSVSPITTDDYLQSPSSTATNPAYVLKGWYFDSDFTRQVHFPYVNLNDQNTQITMYAKYDIPDPDSKAHAYNWRDYTDGNLYSFAYDNSYETVGSGNYPDIPRIWFTVSSQDNWFRLCISNIWSSSSADGIRLSVIRKSDNVVVDEFVMENWSNPLEGNGTEYYVAIGNEYRTKGNITASFNFSEWN